MNREKLKAELDKANRLTAVWQARAKDIERKLREQENMEIIQAVRSIAATPERLQEILGQIRNMKEVPEDSFIKENESEKSLPEKEDIVEDEKI